MGRRTSHRPPYMDQEIIMESNEEVEELFWQSKSHDIKCLRNNVFMCFSFIMVVEKA